MGMSHEMANRIPVLHASEYSCPLSHARIAAVLVGAVELHLSYQEPRGQSLSRVAKPVLRRPSLNLVAQQGAR